MSGEHVFIVEDDQDGREHLRRLFEANGFKVTVAASTDDAHDHQDRGAKIDILICAANLPTLATIEFAENFQSRNQENARIIVLSDATADDLVGLHPNQIVSKPFDDDDLLAMVRRFLRDDFLPPIGGTLEVLQESQGIEARGGTGLLNASLHAAMLRPSWTQDKEDIFRILREAKALYEELGSIFGQQRPYTADNREGIRESLRANLQAQQDLVTSTSDIMSDQLARQTPDGIAVHHSRSVFRMLGESAKDLGARFAEGFVREAGRDAYTTKVPWILEQIHDKMAKLAHLVAHWFTSVS